MTEFYDSLVGRYKELYDSQWNGGICRETSNPWEVYGFGESHDKSFKFRYIYFHSKENKDTGEMTHELYVETRPRYMTTERIEDHQATEMSDKRYDSDRKWMTGEAK